MVFQKKKTVVLDPRKLLFSVTGEEYNFKEKIYQKSI